MLCEKFKKEGKSVIIIKTEELSNPKSKKALSKFLGREDLVYDNIPKHITKDGPKGKLYKKFLDKYVQYKKI